MILESAIRGVAFGSSGRVVGLVLCIRKMRLIDLYDLCRDADQLLVKLREWTLVPCEGEYLCPKCGGALVLGKREQAVDGWPSFDDAERDSDDEESDVK